MPRAARKKSESGVYHIVLRGVNRQTVFYDGEDREVFLNRLKIVQKKHGFIIYAFCLMNNHVHLIIKEKESGIGKIMQKSLTSYIYWYNSKYERAGNLFQDRYKSEPISDDSYLLSAVRYVHQNPVKAKTVTTVGEYKWSSYGAYLNDKESLVETKLVLDILQGREAYKQFMQEKEELAFIEPSERIRITDDKLAKAIIRKLSIESLQELFQFNREKLYEALKRILEIKGANHFQVSRVTGIPMGVVRNV